MAKVKFNPIIVSVSGKVGDFVVKNRGGKAYFSRRPDLSKRTLTTAQKKSIVRFRSAVAYAKAVLADPVARAAYVEKAQKKGIPVYNAIISERMKVPDALCKGQSPSASTGTQDIHQRSLNTTEMREAPKAAFRLIDGRATDIDGKTGEIPEEGNSV